MTYSANFREKTSVTSGEEPLYLLEITHPQLTQPVRVVRDTADLVSNGATFVAFSFDIQLPDDTPTQMPTCPIRMDNVGRELTQWLDASSGGIGSQVRVMMVMRDEPDVLEFDVTLDLMNVKQTAAYITGELGYENTLGMPALIASYRPDNTPSIF